MLRFEDGRLATFQPCGPAPGSRCSLIEHRDADGHVIDFERDGAGLLRRIRASTERITFEYDDRRRVVSANDDAQRRVEYTYDDRGRLIRVVNGDAVRTFAYDARDEMVAIREPGRVVENTFDDNGRVIRQVARISDGFTGGDSPGTYEYDLAYSVVGDAVTETRMLQPDGTTVRYRFDASHHIALEVRDAEGVAPVTVVYDRDPIAHFVRSLTVRCTAGGRNVTATAEVRGGEEPTIQSLVDGTCASVRVPAR